MNPEDVIMKKKQEEFCRNSTFIENNFVIQADAEGIAQNNKKWGTMPPASDIVTCHFYKCEIPSGFYQDQ